MSDTTIRKKIEALEVKQTQLQVLLENETHGTSEWLNIQWDIDAIVEEICDLEQEL